MRLVINTPVIISALIKRRSFVKIALPVIGRFSNGTGG